jgi:hypothetical protein
MLNEYITSHTHHLPHAELDVTTKWDTQQLWENEKDIVAMINFIAFSRGLAIAQQVTMQVCSVFGIENFSIKSTEHPMVFSTEFSQDISGVSQFMCDWVRTEGNVPPLPHQLIQQKVRGLLKEIGI